MKGGESVKKEVNTKIPTLFQVTDTFENEDSRFLKVKIWLMHLEENYNGSYFSKESVINALPSLANTPILAYIEPDTNGEDDFSDHRTEIYVKDGEFEERYLGQAIGVIPETNNAQFEFRVGDDGVEREFLTVEGLIWAKWDKPIEIMKKYNSVGQSMELHDEYTGTFEDDGLFHWEQFKFFGACALGSDVMPAMNGATLEVFSQSNVIKTKLEEFNKHFTKQEEVNSVAEKIKKELEEETVEETKVEEPKVEGTEETKEEANVEAEVVETESNDTEEAPETEHEAIEMVEKAKLDEALNTIEELKADFMKATEEADKFAKRADELDSKVKEFKAVIGELNQYKRSRELGDLKAKFADKLPEDKMTELFETMKEDSIDAIEKEMFAEMGRINFSKVEIDTESSVKVQVKADSAKEYNPYGNLLG